jgi:cell division initiation protein
VKLTPLDIRRREFKRSVRGYLEEDVDVFLDAVADEFERLSKKNGDLEARTKALEEEVSGHAHVREALEKTLVAAQLQSEETKASAEKQSQAIIRDAEVKAKAVIDDLQEQVRTAQQTLMRLKLLEEDFRFKFRALLEGYLRLVVDGPILLSGLAAEEPAAQVGEAPPALRTPEYDDSPTSETVEMAAVAPGDGRAEDTAGKAAAKAPARPPSLPRITPADGTNADLTVETSLATPGRQGGKKTKAVKEDRGAEKDEGVVFGRVESDPDDTFPGGDANLGKARDFKW